MRSITLSLCQGIVCNIYIMCRCNFDSSNFQLPVFCMDALVSFPCLIPVQVSGAGATYDGYLNVNVGT